MIERLSSSAETQEREIGTLSIQPSQDELPLEPWLQDMRAAVIEIEEIGKALLQVHSQASQQAAHVAEQWQLEKRLDEESQALHAAFQTLREILTAVDAVRSGLRDGDFRPETRQAFSDCAQLIESRLASLQQEFLTIRHSALDLLRWEQQFAQRKDSHLPAAYRSSYSRLLAYTPVFRPYLDSMQQELLEYIGKSPSSAEAREMLSALNHYVADVESARAFVQSVVDPPLELVFHDTESFDGDWQHIAKSQRAELATELNDVCQLLLYDQAKFAEKVEPIQRELADSVDALLYVLPFHDWRIVFTVDEDPVFGQLMVTLLRVVPAVELEATVESLFEMLYRDLTRDD